MLLGGAVFLTYLGDQGGPIAAKIAQGGVERNHVIAYEYDYVINQNPYIKQHHKRRRTSNVVRQMGVRPKSSHLLLFPSSLLKLWDQASSVSARLPFHFRFILRNDVLQF